MQAKSTNPWVIGLIGLVAGVLLALGGNAIFNKCDDHGDSHSHDSMSTSDKKLALNKTMRSLWGQHVEWTWSTVNAFAEDSKSLQPNIDNLLANQKDIGDAVGSYYGKEAGDKTTELLQTHIKQAVPVLTAAKAGDKAALDKAVADWHANANDIADYLATANPNLPKDTLREMLNTHIDQTVGYAADILGGKYSDAIAKYKTAEQHMMMLADALTDGIAKQFPDKF